jgi:hypothetical protein
LVVEELELALSVEVVANQVLLEHQFPHFHYLLEQQLQQQ